MFWLGLDIGTGGSRALLVDEKGKVLHAFTAPHEDMRMERPLWAEQRPENWWDAAQAAIRGVLKAAVRRGKMSRGWGFPGRCTDSRCWIQSDQVIRPALIWCDQRSQAQVDAINGKATKPFVLECIANPVLTGFTLPKLLWVRDNEPRNYERVRKVLLPKDYVRFQLTGEYASDVSDASGTALFDVVHRRWSAALAEKLGVDREILPYVYESPDVSGRISERAAEATGLAAGTPVVGGAGDQAASAVGNGIVEAGVVSCTLGTSGVVFAHTDRPAYDPEGRVHTFCHAAPGAWHVMGVTQGAGLSLQWFRNQLAPGAEYDALTAEAATSCVCAQGLYWLPYLMGERTPHLDAFARGGWIGLTAKHTRADLIRAVLEGVSFSQKDCLDVIEQMGVAGGIGACVGGRGEESVLASDAGRCIREAGGDAADAGGFRVRGGVAIAGGNRSVCECSGGLPRHGARDGRVESRSFEAQQYARGHQVYTALYPVLKPVFRLIQSCGS
jgi:xylulokinase